MRPMTTSPEATSDSGSSRLCAAKPAAAPMTTATPDHADQVSRKRDAATTKSEIGHLHECL